MANGVFAIDCLDDTIIVIPTTDLRELDYQRIEAGASNVLDLLSRAPLKNVVLDFHRTDYYGSTALGFFMKLWKRVRARGGRMAFCNVSKHEKDILQATSLDHLWPICSSRTEALAMVGQ
jgi:anti-anti-sigma factor